MALRYLLDTNIISDLIRHPDGVIAKKIAEVGEATVCTSVIVSSEIRFGARKSPSKKLRHQAEAVLAAMQVLPLDIPADERYASIRLHLETAGTPTGPNDMLIAAHALALDLTVVTANTGEFGRVPNLDVENWLAE